MAHEQMWLWTSFGNDQWRGWRANLVTVTFGERHKLTAKHVASELLYI